MTIRATALSILAAFAVAASASAAGFSYDDWNAILATFVDGRGYVAYQALAKDRAALDRFTDSIAKVGPKTRPDLFPTQESRLAYYLNAYNALVFKGVLARGPEKESVWSGGLVPGQTGIKFFISNKYSLDGETTGLKALEDDVVRAQFKDPRVHSALNCASKGCPRLPQKAFDPASLDAELDAAMREFVGEERNVKVDGATRTVTLSKIFDWFAADFGNQIDFVNRYRPEGSKIPRDHRVAFFEYDKSINQQ